jgi:acetolactate synthase I/II/III large subunit
MIRVTDYIAEFIYKQGVTDIFMLSGGGSIYLDDGVFCHEKLNEICVRNEATAPMMAEAYARLNGNLGVAYVTTGPGGTNAVSGLAEAWVDSAPILIISGQVQRNHTTYNAGIKNLRTFGTQELNVVEIVKPLTKYAEMVNDPNKIRYHCEKAVYLARSGRPGPVWLDIPLDVQNALIDEKCLKGYFPEDKEIDENALKKNIDDVIKLLLSSKKPLIIAGQGIRIAHAIEQFTELIETLNVPVIFSRLAQDVLSYLHKNNFGHGGMKGLKHTSLIMKESDLIISIGSRLSVQFIGLEFDAFSENAKKVVVDIEDAELNKPTISIGIPIKSDAKIFINKFLRELIKIKLPSFDDWMLTCQNYKQRYPMITNELKRNPIDLYYFIHRLDALSTKNHIFVDDAGSSYYISGQVLQFQHNQREITSGTFASMGLSIPLSIGCSISNKEAQILAITGDGSLELNIQELRTLSFYDLNIKLFVINNGGYISIRNSQDTVCEGRYIGSSASSGIGVLNLKKIAEAFELPYYCIENYREIDEKIIEIISTNGPAFVEVVCDSKQKIIEPIKPQSQTQLNTEKLRDV